MYRDKPLSVVVRAPTRGLVTRLPGESADYLPQQGNALIPGTQKKAASAASNVRYEEGVIAAAPGYEKVIPTSPLLTGLVAQWSLDEISGIRQDSSSNNHDLSEVTGVDLVSNLPVTHVGFEKGQFNNAALFPALKFLSTLVILPHDSLSGFLYPFTNIVVVSHIAYAVDSQWNFYSSPDTLNWTKITTISGFASIGGPVPVCLAAGSSSFVVTGTLGSSAVSTDGGFTWSHITTGAFDNLNSLIYDGSKFVTTTTNQGSIKSYTSGSSWSSNTGLGFNFNGSIAFGAGLYVAVGNSGAVKTSPDLVTWTSRTSGTSSSFHSIVFNGSFFVAVAGGGVSCTSSDGITWAVNSTGTGGTSSVLSVAYGNSRFVAVTNNKDIITSPDGVTWTAIPHDATITGFRLASYFKADTFVVSQ